MKSLFALILLFSVNCFAIEGGTYEGALVFEGESCEVEVQLNRLSGSSSSTFLATITACAPPVVTLELKNVGKDTYEAEAKVEGDDLRFTFVGTENKDVIMLKLENLSMDLEVLAQLNKQ